MKRLGYIVGLLFLCLLAKAQQNIRGTVMDKDAQSPLIGAVIEVLNTDSLFATVSDEKGQYVINNVPLGRHDIRIQHLGYADYELEDVLFSPSKEVVINIALQEIASKLETIEIKASASKEPINQMHLTSTVPMSVEALERQPANFADPARMALNFPGVSFSGDDVLNDIVVRGNAPTGVLWRLEGVEIPNPNHFTTRGGSGGGITMLSANAMGTSDFFAGAFPAEYGNALSGVFDIHMRNGNTTQRETSIQAGFLGLQLATEGPFQKGGNSSYLVNYRYSTLSILSEIGLNPAGDDIPDFQDLSFKLNFPTAKAGTFSVFGLGGSFLIDETLSNGDLIESYRDEGETGILGFSHWWPISSKTYIKTVGIGTYADLQYEDGISTTGEVEKHYEELFRDRAARLSIQMHHKLNAAHSFRLGGIFSQTNYDLLLQEEDVEIIRENNQTYPNWLGTWTTALDSKGDANTVQAYAQWKALLGPRLTLNLGVHYLNSNLNQDQAWEPRFGLRWRLSEQQTLSLGASLHSRLEALPIYFVERFPEEGKAVQPHRNLPLQQSRHLVLGYEQKLGAATSLKIEAYWQQLEQLPVSSDPTSTYALPNEDFFDFFFREDSLIAKGSGKNYGVDLSLNRRFSKQFYYALNASFYQSEFKTQQGEWFPTRYSSNYNIVALAGKEFPLGRKQKKTLGINGRYIINGGLRYTLLDREASLAQGERIFSSNVYSKNLPVYSRIDVGFYYRIFSKKIVQRISLNIQNVTNRLNVYSRQERLDPRRSDGIRVIDSEQTGMIPVLAYRIEF